MPAESKQISVSELVGRVSANSDLRVVHNRNRYLTTASVAQNSYFRMVVPRISPQALLDCRHMRMRLQFAATSTDTDICVDSNFFYPFQRVRILSGSTVLLDINNANLLMTSLWNIEQNSSISAYEQSLVGDGDLATRQSWADASREYLIPIFPDNTVLRGDWLFDVNNSADLILEFWTLPAATLLYSPAVDTAANYTISNIEILSSFIESPSLASYYQQHPMGYTVKDYSARYATIAESLAQVKLSSSSTSLNGFLTVIRAQNAEASIGTQNKMTVTNALTLQSANLLVNQQWFWDQAVSSFPQLFNELTHMYPKAEQSKWLNALFTTTRYFTAVRVSAAPTRFADSLTSGLKTSSLNNDLVLQLQFASAPAIQRVDTFLQSDVVIYRDSSTRDIQIKL